MKITKYEYGQILDPINDSLLEDKIKHRAIGSLDLNNFSTDSVTLINGFCNALTVDYNPNINKELITSLNYYIS